MIVTSIESPGHVIMMRPLEFITKGFLLSNVSGFSASRNSSTEISKLAKIRGERGSFWSNTISVESVEKVHHEYRTLKREEGGGWLASKKENWKSKDSRLSRYQGHR